MQELVRAAAELAGTQHGLITRAQALALGLTKRMIQLRLERSLFCAVHPSVYRVAGFQETWRQHVKAATLFHGAAARASHRTAARLAGLDVRDPGVIELIVPRRHRLQREGIRLHGLTASLHPADSTVIDGIPATSIARTLFDLAAVESADVVEEALDDAIARGLVSLTRLRWQLRLSERSGRRGIRTMRMLLAARRGGSHSNLETRFARMLRGAGNNGWVQQYDIRDRGRLVGRVDVAFPKQQVAIELDGYASHAGRRTRWERDLTRGNGIILARWTLLRFSNYDLTHRRDAVIAEVLRALHEAG